MLDGVVPVLLFALVSMAVLFVAMWYLYSFSGTWERCDRDDAAEGSLKERILLVQLGPLVVGRRDTGGGYQSFSGFAFGRTVWLRRRDFGKQSAGEIAACMSLNLSNDKLFLSGMVSYRHSSDEKPCYRCYRRAELIPAGQISVSRL